MLFASTVINYVDRQTLSLLAPYLKIEYRWTNTQYAQLVIAFRIAYSIGQACFGRLMDRIGTRRGLTFTVAWYSLVSAATSLAHGLGSFAVLRFCSGAGESANWPAASKAVAEWFPRRERGLATALFDSGSSIGGAVAPFIVLTVYAHWGWRPAFLVPGILGALWLTAWRRLYHPPESHPCVSEAELETIVADKRASAPAGTGGTRPSWPALLALPQTWGVIVARTFTDPVWFFVTDWFPIYLVAKGIRLEGGLLAIWVPFIAADLGNLTAGIVSGHLIRKGWPLGNARKAPIVLGGVGVCLLIPTIFTTQLWAIALLFAFATFSYACFSTMANVLPSDLYDSESVATVSGLGGAGAGMGTIVAFLLVGRLADVRQAMGVHSFDPIVVAAGLIPLVGMLLVLALVRNTRATRLGLVRSI
jgi:ACS family hexuronate transporter-like MFS transporter